MPKTTYQLWKLHIHPLKYSSLIAFKRHVNPHKQLNVTSGIERYTRYKLKEFLRAFLLAMMLTPTIKLKIPTKNPTATQDHHACMRKSSDGAAAKISILVEFSFNSHILSSEWAFIRCSSPDMIIAVQCEDMRGKQTLYNCFDEEARGFLSYLTPEWTHAVTPPNTLLPSHSR